MAHSTHSMLLIQRNTVGRRPPPQVSTGDDCSSQLARAILSQFGIRLTPGRWARQLHDQSENLNQPVPTGVALAGSTGIKLIRWKQWAHLTTRVYLAAED